ncbi:MULTISPECIES: cache domain-containing sensor histidine kinase [unclassified Paenibacillus]|uniref:cache domain-containing sensor histidine kinase n=1 Tax=unclassified Paenibacillus TaxID=185978 RepID=UPI0030F90210
MRYRSFRGSIRYKLSVFLMAAILVPIAASILISYFYTKHSLKNDAIRENSNTVRQGTTSLMGQLNAMNNISLNAYNNLRMTNSLYNILVQGRSDFMVENNIYSGLHAIEQSSRDIQQVYLYSDLADQSWLLIDGYLKREPGSGGLDGHFVQPVDKNDPYLEPPHPSHNYGMEEFPYSPSNTVFTIHRPVYRAPLKERIGVLSIDFKLDEFRSIMNMLYDKGQENIYLLDDTGTAVYTSREDEIGTKPDYAWLQHARYSFAGAGHFYWNRDGDFNGIVVFEKFELIGRIWTVAKQIPDSYLYSNAASVLRINMLVLLTCLFIAIAAALFVSVMVTAPIKRLTESIRRIKLGKLQFDGDPDRSDEVGVLGSAIKNMVDTIDNLIMRELRLELANKDNQLKALQAQINPHFIFNTLQSIGSVALHHKVPRIYELTSSLGLMMRYNMNTEEPVVPLSKEIAHAQAYLELQQQRFKDRLRHRIEIRGEADLNTPVPKMILQPLVENCFKHGFEGAEQAEIGIVVEVSGDTLSITVSDNGPGVTPERLLELERQIAGEQPGGMEGGSIGLMNVVSRLRLFFNDQADVILGHAEPHGFNVQIRIPLTEGA